MGNKGAAFIVRHEMLKSIEQLQTKASGMEKVENAAAERAEVGMFSLPLLM